MREGDTSPDGTPFLRFRDPSMTDVPSVAFRATTGVPEAAVTGVFVVDASGLTRAAVEQQDLGGDVSLVRFTGDPLVTPGGGLALLATRAREVSAGVLKVLGPSILFGAPGTPT